MHGEERERDESPAILMREKNMQFNNREYPQCIVYAFWFLKGFQKENYLAHDVLFMALFSRGGKYTIMRATVQPDSKCIKALDVAWITTWFAMESIRETVYRSQIDLLHAAQSKAKDYEFAVAAKNSNKKSVYL